MKSLEGLSSSATLFDTQPESASMMHQQAFMSAQISIKNQSKPLVKDKVLIGKMPSFPNFELLEEVELAGWDV
jgi:hypothetical protein